ncbi:MAG: exodeoxyribonuclease III [Tetragenococcus koreensis]
MKLISWNIDSLNAALTSDSSRAQLSREVLDTIGEYDADVIAIQETKLSAKGPTQKHIDILAERLPDYKITWRSSEEPARKSYAGTMFLYKNNLQPTVTFPKIGAPDTMDEEGRIITLELENCFVTQVYTPNAGSNLDRLEKRQVWDEKYREYLITLDKQKPVFASGDYNVAHQEIDLAHPDRNHFSAGFTDEERAGFTELLNNGFSDTFRHIHGNAEGNYSWWAQRVKTSKINNSGWRIDYFIVSERLANQILSSEMVDSGKRQDHTPIYLEVDL